MARRSFIATKGRNSLPGPSPRERSTPACSPRWDLWEAATTTRWANRSGVACGSKFLTGTGPSRIARRFKQLEAIELAQGLRKLEVAPCQGTRSLPRPFRRLLHRAPEGPTRRLTQAISVQCRWMSAWRVLARNRDSMRASYAVRLRCFRRRLIAVIALASCLQKTSLLQPTARLNGRSKRRREKHVINCLANS